MSDFRLVPQEAIRFSAENLDKHLVAVVFTKSTSKSFDIALNIASSAEHFSEILDSQGKRFYFAAFGKDSGQCSLALGLIDISKKWMGTTVLVQGRIAYDTSRIKDTLNCISQASRCSDKKAHCHSIVMALGNPSEQESYVRYGSKSVSQWIHPCSRISSYGMVSGLNKNLPSTLQDQLQAQAVKMECEWCPFFNAHDLKRMQP